MPVTQEEVLSALKQCYDPEIPVNIVDLGLIYEVRFEPAPEEKQDVTVDMTLTAQGCPAHVQISDQVRSRLEQLPGIRSARVNVVWSPAWTPERLSADARRQLGIEYSEQFWARGSIPQEESSSHNSRLPRSAYCAIFCPVREARSTSCIPRSK